MVAIQAPNVLVDLPASPNAGCPYGQNAHRTSGPLSERPSGVQMPNRIFSFRKRRPGPGDQWWRAAAFLARQVAMTRTGKIREFAFPAVCETCRRVDHGRSRLDDPNPEVPHARCSRCSNCLYIRPIQKTNPEQSPEKRFAIRICNKICGGVFLC